MGGKRPDQHNLDPGEANSTDYKFRRKAEEGLHHNIDRGDGQPIKPTVPSPDAENPVAGEKQEEEEELKD